MSKQDTISNNNPWTGSFHIDQAAGNNTLVLLQASSVNGAFTAKVTDPALNELTLADSTNWFDVGSSVRVAYLRIDDPAVRYL